MLKAGRAREHIPQGSKVPLQLLFATLQCGYLSVIAISKDLGLCKTTSLDFVLSNFFCKSSFSEVLRKAIWLSVFPCLPAISPWQETHIFLLPLYLLGTKWFSPPYEPCFIYLRLFKLHQASPAINSPFNKYPWICLLRAEIGTKDNRDYTSQQQYVPVII